MPLRLLLAILRAEFPGGGFTIPGEKYKSLGKKDREFVVASTFGNSVAGIGALHYLEDPSLSGRG